MRYCQPLFKRADAEFVKRAKEDDATLLSFLPFRFRIEIAFLRPPPLMKLFLFLLLLLLCGTLRSPFIHASEPLLACSVPLVLIVKGNHAFVHSKSLCSAGYARGESPAMSASGKIGTNVSQPTSGNRRLRQDVPRISSAQCLLTRL